MSSSSESEYDDEYNIPDGFATPSSVELYTWRDVNAHKNDYEWRQIRTAWDTMCHGQVNWDFAREGDYSFIFVAYDENKEHITGILACTIKDVPKHDDKTFMYIDIVCASKKHEHLVRAGNPKYVSGRTLIESAIKLSEALHCEYIKLSALNHVITYYYKIFNFRFMSNWQTKQTYQSHEAVQEMYNLGDGVVPGVLYRYKDIDDYSEKNQGNPHYEHGSDANGYSMYRTKDTISDSFKLNKISSTSSTSSTSNTSSNSSTPKRRGLCGRIGKMFGCEHGRGREKKSKSKSKSKTKRKTRKIKKGKRVRTRRRRRKKSRKHPK
jgi:hypothetical protein